MTTMAVAFAHCEKVIGLNILDGVVQLSCQVVNRAFGCGMQFAYKFKDNMVI